MATTTLRPLLLYPSEQAVQDQFANQNKPFSRDFSYTWKSGVTDRAGGETEVVNLPLIYIPRAETIPGVPWALNMQVLGRSDSPEGAGWVFHTNIVASGSNWGTSFSQEEQPSPEGGVLLTAVISNDKSSWNMPGSSGHYRLNLQMTWGSSPTAHSGTVAFGIVGVHSIIG
jgi:hypothetical protein